MTKKIHNMAIFIEFLAGSGLALFFHLALHHTDAALIIFGTGVLLSLATYLLREEIDQTRQKLMDKYDHAHEVTFAIARITDPECHSKAHEVMASAKRTMLLLQQGYIPLDETEFYMKGAKYLDESRRQVKVVDPLTTGWESKGVLINYYQANLRALDRGVRITRIFVMGAGKNCQTRQRRRSSSTSCMTASRCALPIATNCRRQATSVAGTPPVPSTSQFTTTLWQPKCSASPANTSAATPANRPMWGITSSSSTLSTTAPTPSRPRMTASSWQPISSRLHHRSLPSL